jgi:hypothetical protein
MEFSHLSRKTAAELRRPEVAAVAADPGLQELILRELRAAAPGWVSDGELGKVIRAAKLQHLFSSGVKQTHVIARIPGVESRVDKNWYFRAACRAPAPVSTSTPARAAGRGADAAAAVTAPRPQRHTPAQPAPATAGPQLSRAELGLLVTRFIAAAGPPGDVWVREVDVVAHLRDRGLAGQLAAAGAATGGVTPLLSSLQWVEAGVASDGTGAAYCLLPTYEPPDDDDDDGDDIGSGGGVGGFAAAHFDGGGAGYSSREEDDLLLGGSGGGGGGGGRYTAAPLPPSSAAVPGAEVDATFASAVRQLLRTASLSPTNRSGGGGGGAWIELSLMDELLAAQGLADAAGPEPLVAVLARLPFVEIGTHPVTGELRFQLRAGADGRAAAAAAASGSGSGAHRAGVVASGWEDAAGAAAADVAEDDDDDDIGVYGGSAGNEFVNGYSGGYAYEPTPETSQMPPPAPHEAAAVQSGRSFSHALRSPPPAPPAPPAPLTPQEAPPPGSGDAARAADIAVDVLLEFMEGRGGAPASGALAGSKVRDAMRARGHEHLLPLVPRVAHLVALPAARGRLQLGAPIDPSGAAVYLVGGGSGAATASGSTGGGGARGRAGGGGTPAGDRDSDDGIDAGALEARVGGSGGMGALRRWTTQQLHDNSRVGRWTTSSLLAHVWGRGVHDRDVRLAINLALKNVPCVVKVTTTVEGGGRGHSSDLEFPLFYVADAANARPPPHLTSPGGAPELTDAVRRTLPQLAAQAGATARPAAGGGTTVDVSSIALVQALACDGVLPASVKDLMQAVAEAAPGVVIATGAGGFLVLRVPQ